MIVIEYGPRPVDEVMEKLFPLDKQLERLQEVLKSITIQKIETVQKIDRPISRTRWQFLKAFFKGRI